MKLKKYGIDHFKKIHIELSSYCNAKCKFCARQTKPDPRRMNKNLSRKAIDNLLIPELTNNLVTISLCGNYGDPSLSPNLHYFLDRVYRMNPQTGVWISTNGSTHTNAWWKVLGYMTRKRKVEVCFCFDGIDSNDYRRVPHEKVLSHMKSYIEGGGTASWKFIVFKENEHQIENVRKMAEEMGVKTNIKKSWSHDSEFHQPDIEVEDATDCYNPRCSFIYDGMFYVNALGEVNPCCYQLENCLGYPHLLLDEHPIDEIMNDNSFKIFSLHVGKSEECRGYCKI